MTGVLILVIALLSNARVMARRVAINSLIHTVDKWIEEDWTT